MSMQEEVSHRNITNLTSHLKSTQNTDSLQLPRSSEVLAVYHRICTELYFSCIYSVFFLKVFWDFIFIGTSLLLSSNVNRLSHLYLQATTPQHSHLLYFLPKKTQWSLLACSLFPGSLLIFANLTHCRKRIGKLFSVQNIGPTQATPSSPTHPSWAQRRSHDWATSPPLGLGHLTLHGFSHASPQPLG